MSFIEFDLCVVRFSVLVFYKLKLCLQFIDEFVLTDVFMICEFGFEVVSLSQLVLLLNKVLCVMFYLFVFLTYNVMNLIIIFVA